MSLPRPANFTLVNVLDRISIICIFWSISLNNGLRVYFAITHALSYPFPCWVTENLTALVSMWIPLSLKRRSLM